MGQKPIEGSNPSLSANGDYRERTDTSLVTADFSARLPARKPVPPAERRRFACVLATIAPVAQLDRASGYEPGGREFESLRAHHKINGL